MMMNVTDMGGVIKNLILKAERRYLFVFDLLRLVRQHILKQRPWGKRTSYSQHGEDLAIHAMQAKISDKIFIDVGCYHPLKCSNTRLLKKYDWKGVHVDASRESIRLFERIYPDDLSINAILSTTTDLNLDKFFPDLIRGKNQLVKKTESSSNAQSQEESDILHTNDGTSEINKANDKPGVAGIDIISPNDLYEKICSHYGTRIDKIGFMNIDIEGLGFDFLTNWPFGQCNVEVRCVENHAGNLDSIMNSEVHKFVSQQGYELIWFFRYSTIYRIKQ